MDFYLVRHGEAVSEMADLRRPLAARGRAAVNRLGRMASERRVRVSAILHSGILRAHQTAQILAEHLSPADGLKRWTGLLPEDDPALAAAELALENSPVMLVGHLPHLARLSALLLNGDAEGEALSFNPAVMACVTRGDFGWTLAWTLDPGE